MIRVLIFIIWVMSLHLDVTSRIVSKHCRSLLVFTLHLLISRCYIMGSNIVYSQAKLVKYKYSGDLKTGHSNTGIIRIPDVLEVGSYH